MAAHACDSMQAASTRCVSHESPDTGTALLWEPMTSPMTRALFGILLCLTAVAAQSAGERLEFEAATIKPATASRPARCLRQSLPHDHAWWPGYPQPRTDFIQERLPQEHSHERVQYEAISDFRTAVDSNHRLQHRGQAAARRHQRTDQGRCYRISSRNDSSSTSIAKPERLPVFALVVAKERSQAGCVEGPGRRRRIVWSMER